MEGIKVEIPCNRKVREYTTRQLKALTGLTVSRAYELMRENGSLPVAESSNIMKRGKQLLKLINSFKFPSSIPVRLVDERHMWQFRERWTKYLQGQLDKVVSTSKPVYLVDEVNKHLKLRKSNITCTRIHLIWYIDMYGMENMSPESIATAIIKFGVSDWSKVQPLVNNSKYTLVLAVNDDNIEQEEFVHTVEFIWSIPKPKIQDDMLSKIDNDIKVIKEFNKLWESSPTTYDYKKVFESYLNRLQTLPPSKKKVSLQKESSSMSDYNRQEVPTAEKPASKYAEQEDIKNLQEWNHEQLLTYMEGLSTKLNYGERDFADKNNREKMREFAKRDDFDEVFQQLKDHESYYRTFGNAMQYVRNVVNWNQTIWSMHPCR